MNADLFYYLGVALAVVAVAVSFLGLRAKDFPASRGAMLGSLALFLVLVAGTATYAVVLARDEQEHRRAELAHEAQAHAEEQGAEEIEAQQSGGEGPDTASPEDEAQAGAAAAGAGAATTVEMVEYAFEPAEVTVSEGDTIAAENAGELPHNLTVLDGDQELGATPDLDGGAAAELSADFPPGDYEMVCTIPGHADLGMKGTFTVE